jgi:multidrug efflux pump subunit AcrA (membrane-fusion protein)
MSLSLPSAVSRLRGRLKGSGRFQVGIAALCLGCALGVGATSLFGTSPGDASATREAPRLPVPTARIVKQMLRDELRAPCTPRAQITRVMPPPLPAGTPRVVTAIGVKVGERVETGDLLATVSGVPTFAFVTRIPFYRDLGVGATGPDVAALERALVAAGKLRAADAVFDSRTADALNAIYGPARAGNPGLAGRLRRASSTSVPEPSEVTEVDVTVGHVVPPGSPLMVLAGRTATLSCQVPEAVAVSAGQTFNLGDRSADRVRVRSVGEPDPTSGQREVVVELSKHSALGGETDLAIPFSATKTAVLTVPAGGIWIGPEGAFEVRKVVDGNAERVRVDVGATAGGYVEISGPGLAAGDEIQLHVATERPGASP